MTMKEVTSFERVSLSIRPLLWQESILLDRWLRRVAQFEATTTGSRRAPGSPATPPVTGTRSRHEITAGPAR